MGRENTAEVARDSCEEQVENTQGLKGGEWK